MTSQGCPATRALASLNNQVPARETKRRGEGLSMTKDQDKLFQRQCTHYDMTDIITALKPLEQSYGFPLIEWSHDDEYIPSDNESSEHERHTCSWEGVSDAATNEDKSRSKRLHRRSSSESLSALGKEARGQSLVRAKSKTSCLVSLESFSNNQA
ncbi:hypothetical protein MHU86_6464 [Fragilaria crotonensis]|nr:hypothetical protein MHU86_6464 [Fragilaria crotonensis]